MKIEEIDIPNKCEKCKINRPTKVIFEIGLGRDLQRILYPVCVCKKCHLNGGDRK